MVTGENQTIKGLRDTVFKIALGAIALSAASTAFSQTSSLDADSLYSEAVLSYSDRKSNDALRLLDAALRADPKHIEALELQALLLRNMGQSDQSRAAYQKLIQAKPPSETGPYHYELGSIDYQEQKWNEAATHFQKAVNLGFNVDAARFYMGTIDFQQNKIDSARAHFGSIADWGPPEWRMPALYYMGLGDFKQGYPGIGTREFYEASEVASDLPEDPLAKKMIEGTKEALAPYEKGRWFANLSLFGQYDGNALLIPNSTTVTDQTTGKATGKFVVIAGGGRMSAPSARWQWIGSYRGTYNKNTNGDSASAEFLTHTLDFYITRRPMARFSYGLKLEGSYNFQNAVTPAVLQGYSLLGEGGPYLRKTLGQVAVLTLEALFKPQLYLTASDLSTWALLTRASITADQGKGYANLGGNLTFEKSRTTGALYRYLGVTGSLSNALYLPWQVSGSLEASTGMKYYAEVSPARFDKQLVLRTGWNRPLFFTGLSVGADLSWQWNFSNYDAFTYNEPVASLGLSYTL